DTLTLSSPFFVLKSTPSLPMLTEVPSGSSSALVVVVVVVVVLLWFVVVLGSGLAGGAGSSTTGGVGAGSAVGALSLQEAIRITANAVDNITLFIRMIFC